MYSKQIPKLIVSALAIVLVYLLVSIGAMPSWILIMTIVSIAGAYLVSEVYPWTQDITGVD